MQKKYQCAYAQKVGKMSNSWIQSEANPTFFEDLRMRKARENNERIRMTLEMRDSIKSKSCSNYAKKLPNVDCFVRRPSSKLEYYLKNVIKFLRIPK